MNPIYNIPVIPQNLQREDTIIQIAEALDYLREVSADILNRVNRRIASNEVYLSNISSRVNLVQKKIDKLSGAKKATQVFSNSKYPAVDVNKRYETIFHEEKPFPIQRYNVQYKNYNANNKEEPLETLLFYHVKIKDHKHSLQFSGLGDIPKDITSVNDLLLFNSSTNPYDKYIISDTLQGSDQSKKEEVLQSSEIGAAPASILDKNIQMKSVGQSFSYSPNLGQVPALDVPLHLPDLPGIADDLQFINEMGPGIAPSVIASPVEKPQIENVGVKVEESSKAVVKKDSSSLEKERLPPVPVDISSKQDEIVDKKLGQSVERDLERDLQRDAPRNIQSDIQRDAKNDVPKDHTAIILPSQSSDEISKTEKPKQDIPVPQLDAHANLMDAIRKAGGKAKLKSTDAISKSEQKAAPVTGDLMTDLYAKLAMRRKGISGAKGENSKQIESGTAMHKVSAMIPPPPTDSEDLTDTTNPDDDWDD